MDITLAQTFIAVSQSGSFVAAAKILHISQTTVTARIKNLEMLVRCTLLVRNKSGAHLTENGRRLLPYAHQMIQLWDATRREVPVPSEASGVISIGCEQSLWNPLLSTWVSVIKQANPNISLRMVVGQSDQLNSDVKSGFLDIALVHLPVYTNNICVEHLLDEKLIMISTKNSENYVFVDWGQDFREHHDRALPEYAQSSLYFNFGPAALQYILKEGGKGYFRTRVVDRYLQNNSLFKLPNMPEFSYPVYMLNRTTTSAAVDLCSSQLRDIVATESDWF